MQPKGGDEIYVQIIVVLRVVNIGKDVELCQKEERVCITAKTDRGKLVM